MRFEVEWAAEDMAFRQIDGEANWFILMERTMSGLKEYDVLATYEGESPTQVAKKLGGRVLRRSRDRSCVNDEADRLRCAAFVMES